MALLFTISIVILLVLFLVFILFGIFSMLPYIIEGIGDTIYECKKLKDKMNRR